MFSEDKVTEKIYLPDDFCIFLMRNKKNLCLKLLKSDAKIIINLIHIRVASVISSINNSTIFVSIAKGCPPISYYYCPYHCHLYR